MREFVQAISAQAKKADPSFEDSLKRTRAAIKIDGELADCDASMPARLLRHAWNAVQTKKAEAFGKDLKRLILNAQAAREKSASPSPAHPDYEISGMI